MNQTISYYEGEGAHVYEAGRCKVIFVLHFVQHHVGIWGNFGLIQERRNPCGQVTREINFCTVVPNI